MKSIKYLLPITPVSENSIHDSFYQYVCSVLRCFSDYDSRRDVFILPNRKTGVKLNISEDEESLEILIKSRKIFKGKWEKQLIAVLNQFADNAEPIAT